MKYKELERKALRSLYTIRRIGVNTVIERERIIYHRTDRIIIDETRENKITISILASNPNDVEMLKSALAYAETPLDERQEKKVYYIISKLIPESNFKYLCKRCGSIDELEFDVKSNIDSKFTQAEIDEVKEKYNTTLDDFIQDEVEE